MALPPCFPVADFSGAHGARARRARSGAEELLSVDHGRAEKEALLVRQSVTWTAQSVPFALGSVIGVPFLGSTLTFCLSLVGHSLALGSLFGFSYFAVGMFWVPCTLRLPLFGPSLWSSTFGPLMFSLCSVNFDLWFGPC